MDEFKGEDSKEVVSPLVNRPQGKPGTGSVVEPRATTLSELVRILPVPLAALIGALVVLRIAEGWTVIPLGIIEILLFLLIIRLWLPVPRSR
jgi:hypothetical protein